MKIGYARVSTKDQDLENQIDTLKEYGCEKVYSEKQTGTNTQKREELKRAFETLRNGDIFVCTKIDRLARSIIDLNNLVKDLTSKGISVHFVKDNLQFDTGEANNSMQTLMFNILGSFAQFERDLIVERTSEGRERAKRQGKHLGRQGQPQKNIKRALEMYSSRQENGMSVNDIVKITGVPRSTLYKMIAEQRVCREETS